MVLGIELGSTRIKSVLTDEGGNVIASGAFDWENKLVDGIWTYELDLVWEGVQKSYASLKANYEKQSGKKLTKLDAIGISAMMHGYLAFDKADNLLAPFRTWRNTNTAKAAKILSSELDFNMPLRWSVSHYFESVLAKLEHVKDVDFLTTLAGYVHWKLTGEKVLGVCDASGMFPVLDNKYDADRLAKFNKLLRAEGICHKKFEDMLPEIRVAGQPAGVLTEDGARLLDVSGELLPGVVFCAPEGDAGTGMVATNSTAKNRGNVSAGTSAFVMIVLDAPLSKPYPQIDIINTPSGEPVAMIHVANCTSEINAWANMFGEVLAAFGVKADMGELFTKLFLCANDSDADVGGLTTYNFLSGEHLWDLEEGRPMVVRQPEGKLTLSAFMQAQIYAAVASLREGMDILDGENITLKEIFGHGGFFKTADIGQRAMSAALRAPITVMENAGEGGAWGIALLALYCVENSKKAQTLEAFLDNIFASAKKSTKSADENDMQKFESFMSRYKAGIEAQRKAVETIKH